VNIPLPAINIELASHNLEMGVPLGHCKAIVAPAKF
jgi:hypothetical protein